MKTSELMFLTAATSAILLSSTPARAQEVDLTAMLRAQLAQLVPLLEEQPQARRDAGEPRPEATLAGLRTSGLRTGGLQPSSGLQSAASGLTPTSEWRALFPRKTQ